MTDGSASITPAKVAGIERALDAALMAQAVLREGASDVSAPYLAAYASEIHGADGGIGVIAGEQFALIHVLVSELAAARGASPETVLGELLDRYREEARRCR